MIGSILARLTGGAPSDLPRSHAERAQALADRRARATAKANAEVASAQANLVATHERARLAREAIDEAAEASERTLGAELALDAWGPSAPLHRALAQWFAEPSRAASGNVQTALRDLAARHADQLGERLPDQVLGSAFLMHLVDAGHVQLIGRASSLLGFGDDTSGLLSVCARAQRAILDPGSGAAQTELVLRESELAAERVAADKRGDANDVRARGAWNAHFSSTRAVDVQAAHERAIAAWRASKAEAPVEVPEIHLEREPTPAA